MFDPVCGSHQACIPDLIRPGGVHAFECFTNESLHTLAFLAIGVFGEILQDRLQSCSVNTRNDGSHAAIRAECDGIRRLGIARYGRRGLQ